MNCATCKLAAGSLLALLIWLAAHLPAAAQEADLTDLLGAQQADPEELRAFIGNALVNAVGGYLAGDFDYSLTPTGDELFDRYARAVEDVYRAAGPDDSDQMTKFGALPDTVLAEWEPEFFARPEYWELRYFCAESSDEPEYADPDSYSDPVDFLRAARERGIVTSNTLLLLFLEEEARLDDELDALTTYEGYSEPWYNVDSPYRLPERTGMSGEDRQAYQEAERQADWYLRSLLDDAVAVDPASPWAYYLRAIYRMEYGELDVAQHDVAIGNSLPLAEHPAPFPLPVVADHLLRGEPAGSKTISGSLLGMYSSRWQPRFIRIKDCVKEVSFAYSITGDTEMVNDWLTFQLRLPFAQQTEYISGLVALVTIKLLIDPIEELDGEIIPQPELETIRRLRSAWVHIRYDVFSSRESVWVMDEMLAMIPFHGMRAYPLAYYKYARNEAASVSDMLEVFRDLQEADLTAAAVPPSLLKFEPLSLERYEFERILKRAAKDISRQLGRSAMTPEQRAAKDRRMELLMKLADELPPPEIR